MKVILNQTVPKVGKAGTVVTVADGFARNYLFPRGLAILADKTQIAALDRRLARVAEKSAGEKADAEALKVKLDGTVLKIEGKLGADGQRLFGAITAQNVADALKAATGVELQKKQVALVEPIKRLGTFDVELDLHLSVDANIQVVVFDPNAIVEEEATEDEEESY